MPLDAVDRQTLACQIAGSRDVWKTEIDHHFSRFLAVHHHVRKSYQATASVSSALASGKSRIGRIIG